MQLSSERLGRVRHRVTPILTLFHPELEFITVFVDSTREYLGVVVQLDDRPLLLKFSWIDFISRPDKELQEEVFAQLKQKLDPRAEGVR